MDKLHIERARVTKDTPELKFGKEGTEYVRFTVMWSSGRPDRNGQGFENGPTKFLKVTCFGALAKQVMQTVQPGSDVQLFGKVEHYEWMSQSGPKDDWLMLADMVSPARERKAQGAQQGNFQEQGFQQPAPQQGDPWGGAPQQGGFSQPTQDEPPF